MWTRPRAVFLNHFSGGDILVVDKSLRKGEIDLSLQARTTLINRTPVDPLVNMMMATSSFLGEFGRGATSADFDNLVPL